MVALLLVTLALSGCATVQSWIPSFWDDNQSHRIIDVRQRVAHIDCQQPQMQQAIDLQRDLEWFQLYSQSKGQRQNDVLRIIQPMQETVNDWVNRSKQRQGSPAYCAAKKQILELQSRRAAETILGRY